MITKFATMLQRNKNTHSKSLWENLGIGLSFACAVHCLVTPLLIAFLPIASSTLAHSHELELILLASSFIIVGFTNVVGFLNHHKQYKPIVYMLLGFSLVISGHVTDNTIVEIVLGFLGGGFVAYSIFCNRQATKAKQKHTCSC